MYSLYNDAVAREEAYPPGLGVFLDASMRPRNGERGGAAIPGDIERPFWGVLYAVPEDLILITSSVAPLVTLSLLSKTGGFPSPAKSFLRESKESRRSGLY